MSGTIRATARLQLHRDYTLDHAAAQVEYFSRLGISHLYVSPILTARAGSMHGYDVVDHSAVNPELGGEEALRRLVTALRAHEMGLIVDIVPNHMAVGRDDNAWWLDVLEWGSESPHAGFFDIDWDVPDPALNDRVLAPFLGKPYGEALAEGEIELRFDAALGRFHFAYYEHRFPLAPTDYGPLLRASGETLAVFARQFRDATSSRRSRELKRSEFATAAASLAQATQSSSPVAEAIATLLHDLSQKSAQSRKWLHGLLQRQHYRLAWWRTATDEINWRRFFDVIDLAGLRIQEPDVFDAVHATTLRLFREGLIDGLRVDHVDGLADPRSYCRKLRARLDALDAQRPVAPSGQAYLVVEKILAPRELLNRDWKTDGTSGYVFMNEVGALLHDPAGEAALTQLWTERSGRSGDFEQEQRAARRRIPQELLAADFNACAHALHMIARSEPLTRDWTAGAIRRVLAELLVHFPVYRTYADARGREPADAAIMAQVVADAKKTCRAGERTLVDLVDRWLGGEPPRKVQGAAARRRRLRALARFQQLTSPVAAKSVEDTAFYRHGRLLSRNEVGANPAQFAMTVEQFHVACAQRLERYPQAMLATATHDHKRGEDTRARIAVLSEIPQRWAATVQGWVLRNAALKPEHEGQRGPDPTDEYLLLQMLVGAWPLELRADDAEGCAAYAERLAAWQEKAVREAKRHSGWVEPNLAYEQACREFLLRLLDPKVSAAFLEELQTFVASIAAAGAINGLTQTLLRMTTPGVPDLYQGSEYWDFSLVDPDNRRPVDFALRTTTLGDNARLPALLADWHDGRIKQRIIARTLALRAQHPALFERGQYRPLVVRGDAANHVLAFMREHRDITAVIVVTHLPAALLDDAIRPQIDAARWADTVIELPRSFRSAAWHDALGDEPSDLRGAKLSVAAVLAQAPVGLLVSR